MPTLATPEHHNLQTTPEILAFLHTHHLTKKEKQPSLFVEYDCVAQAGNYRDKEAESQQIEWTAAAYEGDWNHLFRIALRSQWAFGIGRFANSFPLRAPWDSEVEIRDEPARKHHYTALHQAAWHGAPVEIVQGLIDLGASRGLRTIGEKRQYPLDIAREKGHQHLFDILSLQGVPKVSEEDLHKVEDHFHRIVIHEARGIFNLDSMRLPDLGMLRDLHDARVWMPVPGMYGGFKFWWDDRHLVTESFCRVCGGSGRTNHITPTEARLVDSGWG